MPKETIVKLCGKKLNKNDPGHKDYKKPKEEKKAEGNK